ncbi:MAG: FMN-binding domain protein [Candidatus Izimaplasma bacterium HR2]|nr:MAG: FMN-binding domain protein [Candidatus Izimaplasma bacterium HR2]
MKKVLKIFLKLLLVTFLVLVVTLTIFWFRGASEREDALQVEIVNIAISTKADGTYYGYYEGGVNGYRENSVEIIIENGHIVSINNIINKELKSEEFLDELYALVIDNQSLEIDMITGATLTSIAYLKSIEIALNSESIE